MQQLSGLDASFLYMETATTFGHVSSVGIFDPSTAPAPLGHEELKGLIDQRLHLLPMFRRRLVDVPFGLDHPYWIEDPDFDLDFHVRELALPTPGDRRQLAEQVARIVARPLDRSRPLWELYLISGLESDHVAMLTKIHHSAIDGVSGAELMTVILDLTPEPRDVPPPERPWRPEPEPSPLDMLGRGLASVATQPVKAVRFQRRLLQGLPGGRLGAGALAPLETLLRGPRPVRRDGEVIEQTPLAAPRTPFNRTITAHRRWAFGSLSLDDAKAVKNAFGTTLNDVVMAISAGALRHWLQDHEALPSTPLLASVPVSVRTEQQQGTYGNRVSVMIAPIPTHLEGPAERLTYAHEAMKAAKERHRAMPADILQDFAQFASPAVAARAARVAARWRIADRVNPPFNLTISNVPGPNFPLWSMGSRLIGVYPVSAIADGQGLNITVLSYMGNLDFGLLACRELMPDVWNVMDHLGESLAELVKLAKPPKKRSAPSQRTTRAVKTGRRPATKATNATKVAKAAKAIKAAKATKVAKVANATKATKATKRPARTGA